MRLRILRFLIIFMIAVIFVPGTGWTSTALDYFRDGYLASMKRDWNAAIVLFNKSIDLNPGNAAAYVQRASAYQMVDRNDDAIRDYEAALKLRPDYYLAMEYLGKLYEMKNEYSKALEIYSRALPLVKDPKWRSVIQWKIMDARKKSMNVRADRSKQLNR